jgi:hypothetical protein
MELEPPAEAEAEADDGEVSKRQRSSDDYFDPVVLKDRLLPLSDSKRLNWLMPDYTKLSRAQGPDRERYVR